MRFRSLKRWLIGSFSVSVFAALLILCGSPGVETAAPPQPARFDEKPSWPMFGGSPARNMVNLTARNLPALWDVDSKTPNNVLWSVELGSRSYGGPVVARGKVFIGTNNQKARDPRYRTVKMLDADDRLTHVKGQPVKGAEDVEQIMAALPADAKEVECTCVGAGGRVKTQRLAVVPVDMGVLMAFDQADGKFLYQTVFTKLSHMTNDWPLEGIRAAPTVDADRMYYVNNRSEVVCSHLAGKIMWKLDMIGKLGVFPLTFWAGNPPSSVLVVGEDLYLVTNNGVDESRSNIPAPKAPSFLKLRKKDGAVLWQDNSPTAKFPADGNVNRIKELVNRGELLHESQYSNPAYAVADGQAQVIFPGGDGWIYSFSPEGKLLWKFDCNPKDAKFVRNGGANVRNSFMATPVIYKNRVYVGVGCDPEFGPGVGHFWCIDMTKRGDVSPELVVDNTAWPPITKPNPNSAKVWHFGGYVEGKPAKGGRKIHFGRTVSTCAVHDDLVYVAEQDGWIHCLDAGTGQVHWQHNVESYILCSPYWADGKVYQGTDGGDIFVFAHGKTKKILAQNEMGRPVRANLVAVGEVLYVVTGNKLYALKK